MGFVSTKSTVLMSLTIFQKHTQILFIQRGLGVAHYILCNKGFLSCTPLFLSRLVTWSALFCSEITLQFLLREVSKLSVTGLGEENGFNSVSLFTALKNLQVSTPQIKKSVQ